MGLPFYLRRTGTLVTEDGGELASNYVKYALKNSPKRSPGIVDFNQFDAWFAKITTPVYLVVGRSDEPWLRKLATDRGSTVQGFYQGYFGALIPVKEAL